MDSLKNSIYGKYTNLKNVSELHVHNVRERGQVIINNFYVGNYGLSPLTHSKIPNAFPQSQLEFFPYNKKKIMKIF